MLSVRGLTVKYGGVTAVRDAAFTVGEGEIVAIIGTNGAGKTTVLRTISGLQRPAAGEIVFDGNRIEATSPERINGMGIAHVPEGRRLFANMSVLENLEMGAFRRRNAREVADDLERIFHHFPVLKERSGQMAGSLSGGQQQMVAIGRALMSAPKLLLLDEPTLGLSPIMCQEIAKIVREIHQSGRTIVLVEQNARLALGLAERGYVMQTGRIALEGAASVLRDDPEVKRSYLGVA